MGAASAGDGESLFTTVYNNTDGVKRKLVSRAYPGRFCRWI
jgi:hypothetical protein